MKESIYDTITRQIAEAIDEGAALYRMPWHSPCADIANPANVETRRGYRGLNVLLLWLVAEKQGYRSGTWGTYRQWQERGAQVRKGEKAASIVFWKNLRARDDEPGAENGDEDRPLFVARGYSVFNADQVEGYEPKIVPELSKAERIAEAEAFFAQVPARIDHDGPMSCYLPQLDTVQMVPFARFKSAKAFYSVTCSPECIQSDGESSAFVFDG